VATAVVLGALLLLGALASGLGGRASTEEAHSGAPPRARGSEFPASHPERLSKASEASDTDPNWTSFFDSEGRLQFFEDLPPPISVSLESGSEVWLLKAFQRGELPKGIKVPSYGYGPTDVYVSADARGGCTIAMVQFDDGVLYRDPRKVVSIWHTARSGHDYVMKCKDDPPTELSYRWEVITHNPDTILLSDHEEFSSTSLPTAQFHHSDEYSLAIRNGAWTLNADCTEEINGQQFPHKRAVFSGTAIRLHKEYVPPPRR
jgi:hypothetical protein